MGNFSFTFEGLDELKDDFDKLLSAYPDETEKEVYRLAGVFTKEVNKKMPSDYKKSGAKSSIPKNWKRTRETSSWGGYTVGIEIENQAPHWHLVENGHELYGDPRMAAAKLNGRLDSSKRKKGKITSKKLKGSNTRRLGWVPGKGYCLRTREEWDNGVFAEHVGKLLDKLKRRHNL